MKRKIVLIASLFLLTGIFGGCAAGSGSSQGETETVTIESFESTDSPLDTAESEIEKPPKYIFLFIGDGMSYPQIQAASYYLGAEKSDGGVETEKLSFMEFPVTGSAQTFDRTSFAPDSAATATAISTGNKTHSGTINMDTTKTIAFEAISEQLKDQMDYKVGIVTSVNVNHATPAAFYAHQPSRSNYYEIGEEMIASDFDYFAGGEFLSPQGKAGDQTSIYDLAEQAGYQVIRTQSEAEALKKDDGKAIVIAETIADGGAISYNLDAAEGEWVLADYVRKGIEVLDNENGFFLMTEGGKIDWSGHANDAGSNIGDTLALNRAVEEAIKFMAEHPEDTLILVTGDHETGGMSIGFAGTDYDTYLLNLTEQKISYAKYDSDYVAKYKENQTPFEEALADVTALFGLMPKDDPNATEESPLVLTDYEYQRLQEAYARTLATGNAQKGEMTQEEYLLYGSYEPFTVTVTHILNNKSGIAFTSYVHTGLPVPVFAAGNGQELFEGYYDNTDIYHKLAELTGVN